MRISIAMCTYDGESYLQRQLESISAQTLQPYELVICDDGSKDSTMELIARFTEQVAFPVRIFRNVRNLGVTKNFEKAMGICGGDLIALCDQDDEWYPQKLAHLHQLFQEQPQALAAFTDADIIDDNSMPTGRKLWKSLSFVPRSRAPHVDSGFVFSLLKYDYIATGATMIFRQELRRDIFPIPETWIHDAWISWIAALRGGLVAFPSPTIRYRVHGRQQIGIAPMTLRQRIKIIRKKNASQYRLIASRLNVLRDYVNRQRDNEQFRQYVPILEEKIRHLEGRGSTKNSTLRRLCWVLSSFRNYRRFSRGTMAMIADAFFIQRGT